MTHHDPNHALRREVCALTADCIEVDAMAQVLTEYFDRYGEVLRVTSLDSGKAPFFLVDFAGDAAAMLAANSSGFPLFGFRSLIIDLRTPLCAGHDELQAEGRRETSCCKAWPRCERRFFSSAGISATVNPSSGTRNSGS